MMMALQTEIEGYEDKTLNRLIQVEQQRDELLEALKVYVDNEEQSAFERWLRKACPPGDSESVQRQWEGSSDFDGFLQDTAKARATIAKAEQ